MDSSLIVTAVENFVLFATLLALAAFGLAWAARQAAGRGLWRPHPDVLARVYTLMLVAPPVAAAWLVAAALLPQWWLSEAAFDAAHPGPFHELHLLGNLTVSLEPTLARATLLFAIAAALFAAWSSVRGHTRVGGVISRLKMSAAAPPPEQLALVERVASRYGLDVGLVMSDYPFSFVWGYRDSKLILSSGLLHTLTPEELTGVLEHEAAHHARRDNAVKLLLSALSYVSPAFPLSRVLLRWRAAEVEMICDEVAAARTLSPLEVASALVKLRRTLITAAPASASSFIPEDTPSFQRRVHRLIAFEDSMPDPAEAASLVQTNKSAALIVAAVLIAALLSVSLFAPLAVHHAAESVIQIIR